MSKALVTTFDCGYTVTYVLPTRQEPHKSVKRTFEMSAETQHQNNCERCREQAKTEE